MSETKEPALEISELLRDRNFKELRTRFKELEAADISEIFDNLDIVECIVLYRLVPKSRRSEVFSHFSFELQELMLERLPDNVVVTLMNEMEPVDRTKLLEALPHEISTKFILKLSPQERKIAWQLLSYPEDSVGRLMSPEFVSIKSGMTVSQALEAIRWNSENIPENLMHHLFVTDEEGCFLGHLTLSSLVTADPISQLVDDLMDTSLHSLKLEAVQNLLSE